MKKGVLIKAKANEIDGIFTAIISLMKMAGKPTTVKEFLKIVC